MITWQQIWFSVPLRPPELECKPLSTKPWVAYSIEKLLFVVKKYLHVNRKMPKFILRLKYCTFILCHSYSWIMTWFITPHSTKHASPIVITGCKKNCMLQCAEFLYSSLYWFYLIDYNMCPQWIIIIQQWFRCAVYVQCIVVNEGFPMISWAIFWNFFLFFHTRPQPWVYATDCLWMLQIFVLFVVNMKNNFAGYILVISRDW